MLSLNWEQLLRGSGVKVDLARERQFHGRDFSKLEPS